MEVELRQEKASGVFRNYQVPPQFLDEVFNSNGEVNPTYETVYNQFLKYSKADFRALNEHAKLSFLNQGITFSVYSDKSGGGITDLSFQTFSTDYSGGRVDPARRRPDSAERGYEPVYAGYL